jgi:hypothetical protein
MDGVCIYLPHLKLVLPVSIGASHVCDQLCPTFLQLILDWLGESRNQYMASTVHTQVRLYSIRSTHASIGVDCHQHPCPFSSRSGSCLTSRHGPISLMPRSCYQLCRYAVVSFIVHSQTSNDVDTIVIQTLIL